MDDDRPIRRRLRPSLVCEPCKRRKVKCDKGKPCDTCVKNNYPHKCVYGPIWETKRPRKCSRDILKRPGSLQANTSGSSSSGSSSGSTTATEPLPGRIRFDDYRLSAKYPIASMKELVSTVPAGRGVSRANWVNSGPDATTKAAVTAPPPDLRMILVSASELTALRERLFKLEDTINTLSKPDAVVQPPRDKPATTGGATHDAISAKYRETTFKMTANSSSVVYNQHVFDVCFNDFKSGETGAPLASEIRHLADVIDYATSGEGGISFARLYFSSATTSPSSVFSSSPGSSVGSPSATGGTDRMAGVNPYSSPHDTINFYENYTLVFNNEPSRRSNYGPFAWASILMKDRSLVILKQYIQQQKEAGKQHATTSLLKNRAREEVIKTSFEAMELEAEGFVDLLPYGKKQDSDEVSKTASPGVELSDQAAQWLHSTSKTFINLHPSKLGSERPHPNSAAVPTATATGLGLSRVRRSNDGQLSSEMQLISQIKSILPKQRVIWMLLKRFFDMVYLMMPYVDEEGFRREMDTIIGPEDDRDEPLPLLRISKRLDFAHLGLLLILLRFSYLLVLSKHSKLRIDPALAADGRYLLENPIDSNVIDIARSCINQFQIMRKFNFTIFQCTYYLRLYHIFAPEEGDGADGGDSQVFNGMLVQMAYAIGLNREPDNFQQYVPQQYQSTVPLFISDEKVNLLGRKMWYNLVINDFINSYTFGTPMATSELYYDTKCPYVKSGINENIVNTHREHMLLDFYPNCESLLKGPMKHILRLVLDVNGKCKLSELTGYLNSLELFTNKVFGKMGDYATVLESRKDRFKLEKFHRLKICLATKSFYLSIFYHFFLYYETKDHTDLMFFYLKKMLTISVGEIISYVFPMIHGVYDFFEDSMDLFLNPVLLQTIHRTSDINIAVLVRANRTLYRLKTHPLHKQRLLADRQYRLYFRTLSQLKDEMEKCSRICIAALSELSDRYYYAWGAARSQTFILKVVTSEAFYAMASEVDSAVVALNAGQIDELLALYVPALKLAEIIVNDHCKEQKVTKIFRKRHVAQDEDMALPDAATFQDPSYLPSLDQELNAPRGQYPTSVPLNSKVSAPDAPLTSAPVVPAQEVPSLELQVDNVIWSDFADLQFDNAAEVDSLWLQMLSTKEGIQPFSDAYDAPHVTETEPLNGTTGPIGGLFADDVLNFGQNFDFEDSSHFNFFSDLPMDKIFLNS